VQTLLFLNNFYRKTLINLCILNLLTERVEERVRRGHSRCSNATRGQKEEALHDSLNNKNVYQPIRGGKQHHTHTKLFFRNSSQTLQLFSFFFFCLII
jgi:hypothetical protein